LYVLQPNEAVFQTRTPEDIQEHYHARTEPVFEIRAPLNTQRHGSVSRSPSFRPLVFDDTHRDAGYSAHDFCLRRKIEMPHR
jgi:hypothetical protein